MSVSVSVIIIKKHYCFVKIYKIMFIIIDIFDFLVYNNIHKVVIL